MNIENRQDLETAARELARVVGVRPAKRSWTDAFLPMPAPDHGAAWDAYQDALA